jgi:predicted permease
MALAESVRTGAGRPRHESRGYKLLVAGQFACAIVLLAGAGLLMQSFVGMLHVERGYDPGRLIITGLPRAPRNSPTFVEQVLARVASAPDIESAAVMSAPRFGALNFPINLEDRPLPEGDVTVRYSAVTADYFRVLKAQLRAGRGFDGRDGTDAPPVVLINDTLARRFFPSENPLGRRLVLAYNRQRTPLNIVGVVADIRQDAPGEPVHPEVFVHWTQAPWLAATLVVRAKGEPAAAQRAVRDAIGSVDKTLPDYPSQTLDDILDSQVATPRLYTVLFAAFAAMAVALAALGVYGLFSYVVSRRTNEIAVRMALGGRRSSIIRMVVGEGVRLSLAGIVVGLLGSIGLARVMRSLLFEVSPTDPATFTGVVVLLGAVALVACYIPAYRAASIDPNAALRRD